MLRLGQPELYWTVRVYLFSDSKVTCGDARLSMAARIQSRGTGTPGSATEMSNVESYATAASWARDDLCSGLPDMSTTTSRPSFVANATHFPLASHPPGMRW